MCLVKAMVFSVVLYGCKSRSVKKAELWRIDAFELWCWRRLLRVPWTARRSNQSILKEISPEYSLERLMLKLKLQYFGHLKWRMTHLKRPWCWERLKVGGEGEGKGWDGWMASLTQWTRVWVSSRSWWWTGGTGALQFMQSQSVGHDWATELNCCYYPVVHPIFFWLYCLLFPLNCLSCTPSKSVQFSLQCPISLFVTPCFFLLLSLYLQGTHFI